MNILLRTLVNSVNTTFSLAPLNDSVFPSFISDVRPVDHSTEEVALYVINTPVHPIDGPWLDSATFDTPDRNGLTRLASALIDSDTDQAHRLINLGANVNSRCTRGNTPLHWAAFMGNVVAIKILLKHGAAINALNHLDTTPLVSAFYANQMEATKVLLAAGAEKIDFNDPLIWSAHVSTQAAYPVKAAAHGLGKNPISREVFAALVMAQSMKFSGNLHFQGGILDLGKGCRHYFCGSMLESFQAFVKANPRRLHAGEISSVESILESGHADANPDPDLSQLLEEIRKPGTTIQLHIGFVNHAVEIVFADNYLIISDKGGASTRAGTVYNINKNKLTVQMIIEMLNKNQTIEMYKHWLHNLPTTLDAVSDDFSQFIERLYPLNHRQTIDNCSWECIETSVFFTLAVRRFLGNFDPVKPPSRTALKQVQDSFVHWLRFTQLYWIEKYFSQIDREEIPFNQQLGTLAYETLLNIEDWHGMDDRVERLKKRFMRELNIGQGPMVST